MGPQPPTKFFHLNSNLELAQKFELQIKDALRAKFDNYKIRILRGSQLLGHVVPKILVGRNFSVTWVTWQPLPNNFAFLTDTNFPPSPFLILSFSHKTKFSPNAHSGIILLLPPETKLGRNEQNFPTKNVHLMTSLLFPQRPTT